MPDVKLDTTTHISPDAVDGPDPDEPVVDGEVDGDRRTLGRGNDGTDSPSLPGAGRDRLFGNEAERDHPDR